MILNRGLVFKNRIVNALFLAWDALHRRIRPSQAYPIPKCPRKILICNFGNLGDLFIASKAIGSLRRAYPSAEFGIFISPRGKFAVELLGKFGKVHCLEPLYHLKCKAALHFIKMRCAVLREICAEKYDMAIDLHPFYPNAVPLLRAAKIPVRIGYASGGFGSYLTHSFAWNQFKKYLGDLHVEHLRCLGISLIDKIQERSLQGDYLMIHMCSSRKEKNWKREHWIELIKRLKMPAVLMGQGATDQLECDAVAKETGCMNYCNRTSLPEYAFLIQRAKGLISVDSMGVHLAAFWQIPTMVLFTEVETPSLWLPSHQKCRAIVLGNDSIEKIASFVHTEW